MKISNFIIIILSFTFSKVSAQFFDEAQSPLSVKWQLINHQGFKIIYPSELEKDAQRLSNTLPYIYPTLGYDLNQQKTKLPVILQNQGTSSNGFVQLAPKKSQLYTISPQNFDNHDWLNNLSVHEMRHAIQYNKYTKKTGHPFPEEVYFTYLGLSTPIWFLEGDAVATETNHTYSGRGRQPAWIMPYRTALIEEQKMSYSKAYFGSEKNITPGYYQLGYLMQAKMQSEFGTEITNQIISDITRRPLRLYPFSQTLKKLTNYNTKKYFNHIQEQLKTDWKNQSEKAAFMNYKSINKKAKFLSHYYLPTHLPNGKILALKNTKAETAKFVLIDSNQNENYLFKIGYQEMPWYTYGNNKIVWEEYRQDLRYKQRSWNVICTYDFVTKQRKQITHKSRLFSPAISADGSKIIAVKIDLSNKHQLVIINPNNGQITDTIPNPKNYALQTPALNFDGSIITWVSVTEAGKSLWLKTETKTEELISNSRQQLSRPIFFNDNIAFNAHFNGIDNIYEINPQSKEIKALTAAKYGAFNANFDSNTSTLYFNNYQNMGYEIASTKINPQPIGQNNFVYYGKNTTAIDYVFENIPDSTFQSKPYKTFKHIFNFHSLSPSINDAVDRIGLELKSTDLLNTTSAYGSVTYLSTLKKIEYGAGLKYKALYPVFNIYYRNRPRSTNYRYKNQIHHAEWREDYTSFSTSVPVSFNHFNHNFSAIAETGTYYTKRHFNATDAAVLVDKIKFPITYRVGFSHSVLKAERDIAPKWAQSIQLKLQNTPFDQHLNGQLFALESYFYFPGLAKNHTFLASFNYQKNTGTFKNSNEIETVYGYNQIKANSLLKNTLLLNYRFPFVFPDLEIGPFAYIRNVRATLFSHYENIGLETKLTQPKTFGLEIRSDMNLLRYQPIADVGVRAISVNKIYKQNPIFELLFNFYF